MTAMVEVQKETAAAIRVFVMDDHTLFREGLIRLLEGNAAFEIAGQHGDAASAADVILRAAPDVLILDFDLGAKTAVHVVPELKKHGFAGRILVVTAGVPYADTLALIRMGVSGIVHKHDSPAELQRAITDVAEGRVVIDQRYLQATVSASPMESRVSFTERERTVLRYLLQGLANKEIASELDVSESAVKATLQQLFSKTGVRSRSQLVLQAIEKYRDLL